MPRAWGARGSKISPSAVQRAGELTCEAHPSDDVLVVQVASTDIDNNYWYVHPGHVASS